MKLLSKEKNNYSGKLRVKTTNVCLKMYTHEYLFTCQHHTDGY